MNFIDAIGDLEDLYGTPAEATIRKTTNFLTDEYSAWIAKSRFCVLTTVGPDGTDGSPRGDDGPVVVQQNTKTLLMPDWHGNNLIESLRNIVNDGRVSLMFMIPGSKNVIRVNGSARLTVDPDMIDSFEKDGKKPRSVIMVSIGDVYFQCARAIQRSGLWSSGDQSNGLPSPGQILRAITQGEHGGPDYDREWPERAKNTMW